MTLLTGSRFVEQVAQFVTVALDYNPDPADVAAAYAGLHMRTKHWTIAGPQRVPSGNEKELY
jgi:hypothetical protein